MVGTQSVTFLHSEAVTHEDILILQFSKCGPMSQTPGVLTKCRFLGYIFLNQTLGEDPEISVFPSPLFFFFNFMHSKVKISVSLTQSFPARETVRI